MVGAIEFLRKHRDICNKTNCSDCVMKDMVCLSVTIAGQADENINNLVAKVMAEEVE